MDITDLDGLLSIIDDIIERYVEEQKKNPKEFRIVKVDSKLIKKILEHGLFDPTDPKTIPLFALYSVGYTIRCFGGQKLVREVVVLYAKNYTKEKAGLLNARWTGQSILD